MKALIIILALVGLSFAALLVYGGSRDQQPKKACQRIPADKKSEEAWKNWCPPSLATATRPLQARFGPGLDLPKPVVKTISPNQDIFFEVPRVDDPEERRTAKLTLVSGTSAIVEGPDGAKQCLCQPKQPVPARLQGDACSANWQKEHREKGWICQSAGKWGTIPIEWFGGRLKFVKGPEAQVEIK